MCTNNLLPDIATFVGTAEPQSFDALVSKASNVERQMARKKSVPKIQTKIQTGDKKTESKKPTMKKEAMATFVKDERKDNGKEKSREERPRRPSLKERQSAKYSFSGEDVEPIFNELMAAGALKLPQSKRPEEVNKTNDPKYYRYHRLVSHTIKDCYVLKDIIQKMIDNDEIEIDQSSHKKENVNIIEESPVPKDSIAVKFEVDNEAQIVHAYPDMPRFGNPNIPTLYELMTAPSFDVWKDTDNSDASEDDWTVVKKRVRHPRASTSVSPPSKPKNQGRPSSKSNKKKKKTSRKGRSSENEEYRQLPRCPVTLAEFFPSKPIKEEPEDSNVLHCYMTSIQDHEELNTEADDESTDVEVDEVLLRTGKAHSIW